MICDSPGLVKVLCAVLVPMVVCSSGDYDYFGRVVILNPRLLEWSEAVTECEQKGGTLLTVAGTSTMHEVGLEGRWIVWVGLNLDGDPTNLVWESGLPVTWTNWGMASNPAASDDHCVSIETWGTYGWALKNCSTRLPSLCEVKTDTPCHFDEIKGSSLVGFTNAYFVNTDLASCKNACLNSTDFRCLSIEYNPSRNICQLSERSRWTNQRQFTMHDREWDYYHLDCYTNEVNHSIAPQFTSLIESTTLPATTAATEQICFSLDQLTPSENATRQIEMVIKELQDLQTKYKNRRRSMAKESVPDHRPSATYMGGAAVVIVSVVLGVIVLLDAMTLVKYCCHKAKKKKSKKYKDLSNGIAKRAGRSILAERQLALSVQHLVVDFSRSKMANGACSIDDKEGDGTPTSQKSATKHRHLNGFLNDNLIDSDWIVDENFERGNESIEEYRLQGSNSVDKDSANTYNPNYEPFIEVEKDSPCMKDVDVTDEFPPRVRRSHSDHAAPSRHEGLSPPRLSSSWHTTTMAGSPYTLMPFKSRCRSRNQHALDMARRYHMMETSFKQFDDG